MIVGHNCHYINRVNKRTQLFFVKIRRWGVSSSWAEKNRPRPAFPYYDFISLFGGFDDDRARGLDCGISPETDLSPFFMQMRRLRISMRSDVLSTRRNFDSLGGFFFLVEGYRERGLCNGSSEIFAGFRET